MKKTAGFFCVFCFVFLPCVYAQEGQGTSGDVPAADSGMTQQFEGFNLSGYSDTGAKSWDIKGDRADVVGDKVNVTNVNANSYGKEEDMNIKARRGELHKTTGDVFLEKDVVITAERGTQMTTDTLEWQRDKDFVRTNDPVFIKDESMDIRGHGLEAHPDLKDARLKKDVTAEIQAESKDQKDNRIQITSDGPMELDQLAKTAVFKENVEALEITTGRRLKADRMDVYFDDQSKKIKKIICTGNVELHQGGNVTFSDGLVYLADEQKMTLTGRPKLIIDPGDNEAKDALSF